MAKTAAKALEKSVFQKLLDRALIRYETKQALARAIGITPSRYSRLYGGEDYSLNVRNSLRLAKIVGRPASEVLRITGKEEIAALLDELYGGGARAATGSDLSWMDDVTSPDLIALVKAVGPLPEDARRPIVDVAQVIADLYAARERAAPAVESARGRSKGERTR
jgi:transcriptional regulator with XRE-family HTH domain